MFRAHINVEKVADIKAVKYLYKYIFKGFDAATVECVVDGSGGQKQILKYDEVANYLDARCLSPCEACWRIFKFPLQGKSHSVMPLSVHLENEQIVYVDNEADDEDLQIKAEKKSTLLAYFEYMQKNPDKNYLYGDMPEFCTWNSTKGVWTDRKTHFNKSIGRLYPVNPSETEKYYLYYLLLNVPGRSYKDLKTVNGKLFPTFAQACLERGLCQNDEEWHNCLEEAKKYRFPRALRTLFVNILVHCGPKYPELLWNTFKDDLSYDVKRRFQNLSNDSIYQKTLSLINDLLKYQDKSLKDFKTMPQLTNSRETLDDDDLYDPSEELSSAFKMINLMNEGQKAIIEELKNMIEEENGEQKCLFIDGPGGTGKSFTLTAIYHLARGNRKKVCNMAFTGIAATNLKKGRTLHNRFKLPLNVNKNSNSGIENIGKDADELRNCDIFIWDEAPMASLHMLEIIDKKLKELMKNDKPFGGKTFILSGDFRQMLAIKEHATRTEIVALLIKKSKLWKHFDIMHLIENMRADPNERQFAKDVLEIGDGKNDIDGYIQVPDKCISNGNLIEEIYGDIIQNLNYSELSKRAILSPLNSVVDEYNKEIMEAFPGEYHSLLSIDETENNQNFPVSLEILHSLKTPGIPEHNLNLKINSVIMLLRNLNIREGLCNGTRLQLIDIGKNILCGIILNGDRAGETAFIPRITLIEDKKFPFLLKRHQFPIRIAYALTINKSQSQTFWKIGIDYRDEPFAHGQTYTGISRAKSWDGVKIRLPDDRLDNRIRNIVWKEVL
jgi:hypothetical protein